MSHGKAAVLLVLVLGAIVFLGQWVLQEAPRGDAAGDTARAEEDAGESVPDTAQVEAHDPVEPSREAEVATVDETSSGAVAGAAVPRLRARYLAGEVRDPEGRPLASATVLWGGVWKADRLGPPQAERSTRTDADGRFRLEDLPLEGARNLYVWHGEHPTLSVGNLFPPSTGLDLGVLIMEPGGRAYGRVQGPDGRVVTDAVVAFAQENSSFWMSPDLAVRRVQTDENGNFLLAGLAEGTGVLWSEREGLARARQEGVEVVAGQDAGPFPLLHDEGVSLFGTVVDAEGQPVPDAQVDAVPRSRPWYEREEKRTLTTDGQGRFSTPGLSLETLTVTVNAEGFGTAVKQNVIPGDAVEVTLERVGVVLCRVVDAADGAPVSDVEFRQEGRQGSLEVEPLEDGRYQVSGAGPGKILLVAKARGYGQGRSEALSVPADGTVEDVTIELSRGAVVTGLVRTREDGAPVPGVKVSLVLVQQRDQQVMEWQVVSSLSGVEARIPGVASDTTGEDGRFVLAGVGAGDFRLRTEHPDFAPALEALTLEQDQLHPEVVLEVGVGGSLTGFVLDHQGLPLAGQTVRVEREERDLPTQSATSSADGSYLLERLAEGAWRANWHKKQEQRSSQVFALNVMFQGGQREPPKGTAVRMEDGATVTLDFRDEVPCTVQGFVSTRDGPVEGATVTLSGGPRRSGMVFRGSGPEGITDSAGFYRIDNLEPGKYRTSVLHPEAPLPTKQDLSLVERRTYDQDFLLEGAVLEGTVLSPDRRPVEGAVVTLSGGRGGTSVRFEPNGLQQVVLSDVSWSSSVFGGSSSTRAPVRTDADGRFRMILVPDGSHQVTARHDEYRSASTRVEVKDGRCDGDCVVSLLRAASIRVEVRSETNNRPVTGVMVRLREDGGRQRRSARTDAKGQVLFQALKDGDYRVQVDGDEGRVERTVSVSAGGEVPVVISL